MLKSNNFSAKYRIYYEDTDAGGVVYYANYLKFFERARTDFLRSFGVVQNELLKNENLAFVVKRCDLEYQVPAKLDDLVDVSVIIKNIGAASLEMLQEMRRDEQLLAILNVTIVSVAADDFKVKKISQNIRQLLENS